MSSLFYCERAQRDGWMGDDPDDIIGHIRSKHGYHSYIKRPGLASARPRAEADHIRLHIGPSFKALLPDTPVSGGVAS